MPNSNPAAGLYVDYFHIRLEIGVPDFDLVSAWIEFDLA